VDVNRRRRFLRPFGQREYWRSVGVRVALFEAESLGWGASCRNGGMVLTGMKLPGATLIKRYGREVVQRMYAARSSPLTSSSESSTKRESSAIFRAAATWKSPASKPISTIRSGRRAHQDEFQAQLRIIPKNALQCEIGSPIYFGGLGG